MESFSSRGTTRFPESHEGSRASSGVHPFKITLEMEEEYPEPTFSSLTSQPKLTSAALRSPPLPPTTVTSATVRMSSSAWYRDRLGDGPLPLPPTGYEQRPFSAAWQQEPPQPLDALGRVTSTPSNWDLIAHRCIAAAASQLVGSNNENSNSSGGQPEPIGYGQQKWLIENRRPPPHRLLQSLPPLAPPPPSHLQPPSLHETTVYSVPCSSGYAQHRKVSSSGPSATATVKKSDVLVARPTWSQVTRSESRPPNGMIGKIPVSSRRASSGSSRGSDSPPSPVSGNESQVVRPKTSNAVKLLAESLSFMTIGAPCLRSKPAQYPVVRLSNIPWSISLADVREMLSYVHMPDPNDLAQNVHIVINKLTGKTLADAFVEVATEEDAIKAVKHYHHPPVKGRKLYIMPCSQDRLLKELFPEWPGKFVNGKAILMDDQNKDSTPPPLIQRKEFESLLAICRNFKLHFSRKCGERPFENFISMLVKFPWDQPDIITTMQRDHLYEYYKLATNVLKNHLAKPYVNLDPQLMTRMIRAALQCPGLTVPQKRGILVAGNAECPPDLTEFIETPLETVVEPNITAMDEVTPSELLGATDTL